jgi:hypothetical protein
MSRTPPTLPTLEVPPMLDKVLVLSASAGAGHVRAAQAIERALTLARAAREVRHVEPKESRAMRAKLGLDPVRRLARPRAAQAIVTALQGAGS